MYEEWSWKSLNTNSIYCNPTYTFSEVRMKSQEEAAALAGVDLSHLTEEEIQVFDWMHNKTISSCMKV